MPTPDSTAGHEPPSTGHGPVNAAFGLLAVTTRELIKLPFTVLRFQVHTIHRTLLAADALRKSAETLVGAGIGAASALRAGVKPPAAAAAGAATAAANAAATATKTATDTVTDAVTDTVTDTVSTIAPDLAADNPDAAFADFAPAPDAAADPEPIPDTDEAEAGFAPPTVVTEAEAGFAPAPDTDPYPDQADAGFAVPEVTDAEAGFAATPVTADAAPVLDGDVEPHPVDIVTRAAEAAEAAAADPDLPVVDRDSLPIVDFDHVTAGSLRGRLRRLDLEELRVLRMYEQEHARRLPILTLLENRIVKLEADAAG